MGKIIQTLTLIIMIVLFPPAALITVSGNAAPGDFMYPVKRSLENGVLFLASFNPYTKAYFSANQANKRYEETATLLSQGDNADSSLQDLVNQTSQAAENINDVKSKDQKTRLIADLSDSIEKYDQGLEKAQQQIDRNSPVTQSVESTPRSTSQATPLASSGPNAPSPSVSQPTPKPSSVSKPNPDNPEDDQAKKQQEAIEKARKDLEELRRRLEEEKRNLELRAQEQPPNNQPSPSPSPSPSKPPSPSPSPIPSNRGRSFENPASSRPDPSSHADESDDDLDDRQGQGRN